MEAARTLPTSAEDYLAFEESSEVRHEYVGGEIHAMSGGSAEHNKIAGNIYASLRGKLRGSRCQVFLLDFKLRLEVAREDIFYYPDVMVSGHPAGIEKLYLRLPTLICEVLSPSTETIDRREKKIIYQQIPTLEEYVIVAQDRREVILCRRARNWAPEIFTAPDAVIEFGSIKQTMTLAEIYEDVSA